MTQIVLDAEAFKALSSDTRLQILKSLDARPLTVSEMGRLLGLNKATVFEHLKQLSQADLVKKSDDEGRKWVYYKLTWKGKNVLHPENVQFMLLLGTAALSVAGAVATLGRFLEWWGPTGTPSELGTASKRIEQPSAPPSQFDSALRADAESADAPQQAGAFSPSNQTSPQPTSGVPPTIADDTAAEGPTSSPTPTQDAAASSVDEPFWNDPTIWLLATLLLLIVVTGLFGYAALRGRRRERRALEARLQAIPAGVAES